MGEISARYGSACKLVAVQPVRHYGNGMAGKWKSWFCGSWTVVNTHEMAVISGLAVAYRLGAAYPFEDDRLASLQFYTYLRLVHGVKPRKPRTKA
eukprot:scaffold7390_cov420-Prasinococcus_capsulatus_cf.AAC.11